jgi:uncharacterized coiled-coil protein SlyX
MNPDQAASNERLAERLTQLEEFCTFLQRTVNDLDHVVLEQQQRIESLEARLLRLNSQFDRALESTESPLRPEDEKPPHY